VKGIILAGGSGTRLYPVTQVRGPSSFCRSYDKPMIYYPLSTLMFRGHPRYPRDLHTAGHAALRAVARRRRALGLNLQYAVQPNPGGIAQALLIGEHFVGKEPCALVLGDNIFNGHDLASDPAEGGKKTFRRPVFAYQVQDPQRYGVIEFRRTAAR